MSGFTPKRTLLMSDFDPATVRRAVMEFTPRRPQRFQELAPAKEFIVELRQKRASYRAIAELLTQHCLPASKTAIASFCHEVLGEITRPKRRPVRKRIPTVSLNTGHSDPTPLMPKCHSNQVEVPPDTTAQGSEPPKRGPRIAQVRMLNHEEP